MRTRRRPALVAAAILLIGLAPAPSVRARGAARGPSKSRPAPVSTPAPARAKASEKTPILDDAGDAPAAGDASAKPTKAKVYNFSGLDLEGKLKTPQLLYFLNRVKVELDSTNNAKRSFMKDLERSADDKGL